MNREEFFSSIDAKISRADRSSAGAADIPAANQAFLETVVARLQPVVASYQARLAERNIVAEVKRSPASISFTLRYRDGGHCGLTLDGHLADRRIEITAHYTNDNGRNYVHTGDVTYGSDNWQDSIFEDALQKCIDDFLFYASRHGGIYLN